MEELPAIDLALVDALERRFRDQTPNPTDTDRQVWIKVGNVEVVRLLRAAFEFQNETVLQPETA